MSLTTANISILSFSSYFSSPHLPLLLLLLLLLLFLLLLSKASLSQMWTCIVCSVFKYHLLTTTHGV